MKKKLMITVLLAMLVLLVRCPGGETKSEEVISVIEKIDNIGHISEWTGSRLNDIAEAYEMLTDEEKEQIENYEIYESAVQEYASYMNRTVDKVVEDLSYYEPGKEEDKKDMLHLYYDYMSDEQKRECLARYLFYERAPKAVELTMKYNLRDPDSFKSYGKSASNEITYDSESDRYKGSVHISYGGANLFGATVRKSKNVIVLFSIDIENKDIIFHDLKY